MRSTLHVRRFISAVLMTAALSAAHAGTWTQATTYSGGGSWTLNGSTTNFTWSARRPQFPALTVPAGQTATYNVSGTITNTYTWVPATGMTMTTDPPPDHIWLFQSGSAAVSGNGSLSVNDGLSDATTTTVGSGSTPTIESTESPASSHLSKVSTSSGTATLSDSVSASGSDTELSTSPGVLVSAIVGYSTSIHAQPYGWTQAYGIADGPVLKFLYTWKSTSGNLADLVDPIKVHEIVTYGGTGLVFLPPSPPFNVSPIPNPTITYTVPVSGSSGSVLDTHVEPGFTAVPSARS